MLSSERRSLIRFLLIYLMSTFLLFTLASWIFYTSSKHHLLDKQREMLKYEAEKIESSLRMLHQSNDTVLYYPDIPHLKSAIFDASKKYIYGSMPPSSSMTENKPNTLYNITKIEPYYLGAAYLLTSRKINYVPIENLQKNILFFMLLAGIAFTILGYFLGRLFVAPMRQSLEKMNHFIQDTTHELNTPISVILTNIELIDTFGKHEESSQELKRIEIASKTLSRIYDDLTYLNLNHQYHRDIVSLNLSQLTKERILYFATMAEAKGLKIITHIDENIIKDMDKNDALRLIDNLLSNGIKYNKHQGFLEISLTYDMFLVKDTGIGIKEKELTQILQRFKRANSSEGGFGIGLHIVSQVCKSYAFTLKIDSIENEGTKVYIKWTK